MRPAKEAESDFNSRPSARGDFSHRRLIVADTAISIHAPPRGATFPSRNSRPAIIFQFTPLREGRRSRATGKPDVLLISIHAPPRGATLSIPFYKSDLSISIHAPPRGATRFFQRILRWLKNFNSRPSARGDLSGALFFVPPSYFNSRPSARGDMLGFPDSPAILFQFTPLREGRRIRFKSTIFPSRISIHAPPRGATSPGKISLHAFLISIHAPPRGATCRFACCFLVFCISIHAPPRGATPAS